ncbi:LytTR family DNA-binding domain-containing protein [Neotabrizicola shimadae]|uniref:LytTR family transcriptional regulator n=1 Tax=Neotabrizicola shimadae TaxID=2807096 RepID=A0A8G0ZTE8_9RHOB|nr:LytTR family DNA-binding domain-containing protein [Neotabrizicola shimadae]QYZ70114.1 LytTR family transcriptional regulator [Neotabrizicola shimadae]
MRRVFDEWLAPFRQRGAYMFWLAVSLAVALVGPFGTYAAMDLPSRFVLWGATVALVLLAASLLSVLIRRVPRLRDSWLSGLAVGAMLAILLSFPFSRMVQAFAPQEPPVHSATEIGASLFFATMAAAAFSRLRAPPKTGGEPAPAPQPAPSPDPAAASEAPEPRLLRRLDPDLRGRLISISVRDHYVDVVTTAGRASLLMRLSDAMAEAEGEEGARIHRSHWVARHAARGIRRSGNRVLLELADGNRLPVSRTQRSQIDGWDLPETEDSQALAPES